MAISLLIENLTKSVGDRMLFADVTFSVEEGDKIGIIAKNGTGKTTLLRCIAGIEAADSGTVTLRSGVRVGMLEQVTAFPPGLTVAQAAAPDPGAEEGTAEATVRLLTQMGVSDMSAAVDTLSGGQRKRIALARLMASEPDILILDEPTNHLDIPSKDVLKEAIADFNGTVILVSHDRYFLDGLVDKVYEFGGGKVREHLGGIYDFLRAKDMTNLHELEKKDAPAPAAKTAEPKTKEPTPPQPAVQTEAPRKLSYAEQKERAKMVSKAEKKVKQAEETIAALELEVKALENKIGSGDASPETLEAYQATTKKLENEMSVWEIAQQELDALS